MIMVNYVAPLISRKRKSIIISLYSRQFEQNIHKVITPESNSALQGGNRSLWAGFCHSESVSVLLLTWCSWYDQSFHL